MRIQVHKRAVLAFGLMAFSILLVFYFLFTQSGRPEVSSEALRVPGILGGTVAVDLADAAKAQEKIILAERASESLFRQAKENVKRGDYLSALKDLAGIDGAYSKFALAEELSRECEEKLVELLPEPVTIEEYLACERKVNDYLDIKQSAVFAQKKQQMVRERDDFFAAAPVIETAEEAFGSGRYREAFETLEAAREDGGNRFISEKLEALHSAFVEDALQEIREAEQGENYESALRTADQALAVYDCEELRSARQRVLKERDPFYSAYSDLRDSFSSWLDW